MDTPSRIISFSRNPPISDMYGKPKSSCQTPGVVRKKLSVVRNSPTAIALPTAEAFAENGRSAISVAILISAIPNMFDTPWVLEIECSQLVSGLLDVNFEMLSAS